MPSWTSAGERAASPFGELSTVEVLERLEGPLDEARGLPNEVFTSAAFFSLERDTLFTRSWTFAGRASELPQVGDRAPVDVVGHPLFAVRDAGHRR